MSQFEITVAQKFAIPLVQLLCGRDLGSHEEPMLKAVRVDVVTDNDSVRINPVEPREGRAWVIEAGIRASCEEYPREFQWHRS